GRVEGRVSDAAQRDAEPMTCDRATAATAAAAAALLAGLASCGRAPAPTMEARAAPPGSEAPKDVAAEAPRAFAPAPIARAAVVTDWCGFGFAALDEETCYLLPDGGSDALL